MSLNVLDPNKIDVLLYKNSFFLLNLKISSYPVEKVLDFLLIYLVLIIQYKLIMILFNDLIGVKINRSIKRVNISYTVELSVFFSIFGVT